MEPQQSLESLARELAALPPSLGPVRLIGIDGHAGSGKSTFAARLAEALGQPPLGHPPLGRPTQAHPAQAHLPQAHPPQTAPVLHLDDVASHEELFGWEERLRAQVLEPLAAGRPAHWAPYDWVERHFGPERVLEPAPVLLIEGVGAGRRALRPHLARLLWMETPRAQSWMRGRNRDGRELSDFWDGWERAERAHFSSDPSRPFADTLVRQSGTGYEWSSGAGATVGTAASVTEGDELPRA
ncbi:uridine kinase [Streptomyces sp. NPDC002120]|uniref:uridine kinase family protein n=1 Tax=Streptomyces sp. NPDC002120 TaxID=3364631 RepID=UPI00369513B0